MGRFMRMRGIATRTPIRVALCVLASVSVLTATACSSSSGGSGGKSSGLDFTYWSMFSAKEPEATVLKQVFAAYEKATGAKITVQWQGRDVMQKVTAALNTSNVPDLIDDTDYVIRGSLVANNNAASLAGLYKMAVPNESGTTVGSRLSSKLAPFTTVKGVPYMVPYEVEPYGFWFDARKYPTLADNPPATWSDFTTLLASIKSKGGSPLALDGDIAAYDEYWVATALLRALGPGNLHKLVADKAASGWSNPSIMTALDDLQQLVADEDFVAGYNSSKWPAIQQKWAAGEASFLYLGSWVPNEASAYAPKAFKYATINFPALAPGGSTAVPSALNGFAVIAKAKNQSAAEKFIAYFMQKNQIGKITSVAKTLTSRSDVTPPPQLADMSKIVSANSLTPVNDGIGADFPDFDTNTFQPLCAKLMTGQISASQFVSDIKQQQSQYWKLHG